MGWRWIKWEPGVFLNFWGKIVTSRIVAVYCLHNSTVLLGHVCPLRLGHLGRPALDHRQAMYRTLTLKASQGWLQEERATSRPHCPRPDQCSGNPGCPIDSDFRNPLPRNWVCPQIMALLQGVYKRSNKYIYIYIYIYVYVYIYISKES